MFRGLAKLFRPLARKLSATMNRPEVRNVLKTVGKETLNTGGELLIDSLNPIGHGLIFETISHGGGRISPPAHNLFLMPLFDSFSTRITCMRPKYMVHVKKPEHFRKLKNFVIQIPNLGKNWAKVNYFCENVKNGD